MDTPIEPVMPPDAQEISEDFGTNDPIVIKRISDALKRNRQNHDEVVRALRDRNREMDELNAVVSRLQTKLAAAAEGAIQAHEEMARMVGTQFTEEDVQLIKAHVRHPGAIEAAMLRERIRCALVFTKNYSPDKAVEIVAKILNSVGGVE